MGIESFAVQTVIVESDYSGGKVLSKQITKHKLEKLIRQGKRQKAIAHYFNVSRRTIGRYIKRFGLLGIAKTGRPPRPRKPEAIKIKRFPRVWVSVQDYIQRLNEEYQFVNIQSPPYRYVHQKTLVCANSRRNPRRTLYDCWHILHRLHFECVFSLCHSNTLFSEPCIFQRDL